VKELATTIVHELSTNDLGATAQSKTIATSVTG
jgi:hypothetical protein